MWTWPVPPTLCSIKVRFEGVFGSILRLSTPAVTAFIASYRESERAVAGEKHKIFGEPCCRAGLGGFYVRVDGGPKSRRKVRDLAG
jgi:hypothetical protein